MAEVFSVCTFFTIARNTRALWMGFAVIQMQQLICSHNGPFYKWRGKAHMKLSLPETWNIMLKWCLGLHHFKQMTQSTCAFEPHIFLTCLGLIHFLLLNIFSPFEMVTMQMSRGGGRRLAVCKLCYFITVITLWIIYTNTNFQIVIGEPRSLFGINTFTGSRYYTPFSCKCMGWCVHPYLHSGKLILVECFKTLQVKNRFGRVFHPACSLYLHFPVLNFLSKKNDNKTPKN